MLAVAACSDRPTSVSLQPTAVLPTAEATNFTLPEAGPTEAARATDEPATEAPVTEATVERQKVTLTIAASHGRREVEALRAQLERYTKLQPNVTVKIVDQPDLATASLSSYRQFLAKQPAEPDIYLLDLAWSGDLAEYLLDLNQYGAGKAISEHFPVISASSRVDGRLIGLPWAVDGGLLYYRTDLLEKYGYNGPPQIWDQLEEMAETIQEGEQAEGDLKFEGFVWPGQANEDLTYNALEWIYSNGGGMIVSPERTITINNPKAVEAIDRATNWIGTISPSAVPEWEEEDVLRAWQAGHAAFMRGWSAAYHLSNQDGSAVKGKFDVAPLPAGELTYNGIAALHGWQLTVSKYSQHPEIAAELVLFLTSKEEQKIRAIEAGLNPTIKSLYSDTDLMAMLPFLTRFQETFPQAITPPSIATAPKYAETSELFFKAIHTVLTGQNEAQLALEKVEADLQELLRYKSGSP